MRCFTLAALFGLLSLAAAGPARAQSPSPGQPYQVPAGYEVYGPGAVINYGGYNYVILGDGTMLVAPQPAFTSDLPPVQYVAYDQAPPQYLQPFPQYFQPFPQYVHQPGPYGPSQGFGASGSWQPHPGWGAGYSVNQMGAYTYQPVNYHGHNLYNVQGSMNGHAYQGLFTSPPHHHP